MKWCTSIIGTDEIDACFKAVSAYLGLRYLSQEGDIICIAMDGDRAQGDAKSVCWCYGRGSK